ncbi:MAG: hypothetical protein L6Q54_02240 [Leptospiraceae bacterium]|nr:hypothetical protein [Leptospiraceae bacterium]MCK6380058.1 hypothetical protein [Leptospiraceae bacterium]NUM40651.1 hypothetical protein [Leptospiraceae bacterium]
MNFGEGVQKISSNQEPVTYIQPIYPQRPISKIEKVKSDPEQFFSKEKFNEMKEMALGKPDNFRDFLKGNISLRGSILDITA